MLTLIAKDFKLLFSAEGSVKKRLLSTLATVLMAAFAVGIELFIFTTILDKIRQYHNASIPFLTLFLFIISCLMILLDTMQASKLFFNEKDNEQLVRRPVTNGQIVSSKLVFLFFSHYVLTFLLVYPILVSYGILVGKQMWFYYAGIFYPVLSFLFEGGIALLLVYPYKLLSDFLKKHTVVQFLLALLLMVGGCIVYSYVLGIFMELVVNNNINAIFTQHSIDTLIQLRAYLVPLNFLVDSFFLGSTVRLFSYLCIAGGIFILGTALIVFSFAYLRSLAITQKRGKIRDTLRMTKPYVALIKKELFLLFKDSNNIFSFTGLLIIQPFLVYVVLDSLNSVLTSGAFSYYMIALPELLPLIDMLIVMLFTLIINQGASEYIQIEKRNVRIMKTIPVDPLLQLAIKVLVPFGLSTASLFVTVAVLLFSGTVAPLTAFCTLFMTWILLAIFDIVSLKEEMRITNSRPRSTILSVTYSYLLPFSFFAVALVSCVFGAEIWVAYLIGGIVFPALGAPHVFRIKRKLEDLFIDLEMVN